MRLSFVSMRHTDTVSRFYFMTFVWKPSTNPEVYDHDYQLFHKYKINTKINLPTPIILANIDATITGSSLEWFIAWHAGVTYFSELLNKQRSKRQKRDLD